MIRGFQKAFYDGKTSKKRGVIQMNRKILLSIIAISATIQSQSASLEELNAKFDTLSESVLDLKESPSNSIADRVSIGGYGKMDYIRSLDKDSGS